MEHRVTITTERNGRNASSAEVYLAAVHEHYPDVGAVLTQDTEHDRLSITLALDAFDSAAAVAAAASIALECFAYVPMQPGRIVGADAELVADMEPVG